MSDFRADVIAQPFCCCAAAAVVCCWGRGVTTVLTALGLSWNLFFVRCCCVFMLSPLFLGDVGILLLCCGSCGGICRGEICSWCVAFGLLFAITQSMCEPCDRSLCSFVASSTALHAGRPAVFLYKTIAQQRGESEGSLLVKVCGMHASTPGRLFCI